MDLNSSMNATLSSVTRTNSSSECGSLKPLYFDWEPIYYLAIMCPIAFIGLFSNVFTFRVFLDKSFNSITFKYLKLITIIDFLICLTVIPYCLTSYTRAFNYVDLYLRNFYLAYIYFPMANLLITLSMYLNLLVTIERLISVGWPTKKYVLFKPSRYYLSVISVIALSVLVNLCLFFLYKAKYCASTIEPSAFSISMHAILDIFQVFKEIITRVLPLIILIISNVILICIVKKSRKKMRKNRDSKKRKATAASQQQQQNEQNKQTSSGETTKFLCFCNRANLCDNEKQQPKFKNQQMKRKVNQDNQLTQMTIFVAILYTATTIPMVFAFPGLIFKDTSTPVYKTYAAWSNILELIQCSFRFLIYICFTTQFRQAIFKMLNIKTETQPQPQQQQLLLDKCNGVKNCKEAIELLNVHQV